MNSRLKRWVADGLSISGVHVLLLATAAATLLPFFWMISTSFKSGEGIFPTHRPGSRTRRPCAGTPN